MTERPILFSGPMVRALLDGTKTQTRRVSGLDVINREPDRYEFLAIVSGPGRPHAAFRDSQSGAQVIAPLPYGVVGDRLWVRETWASLVFERDRETGYIEDWEPACDPKSGRIVFDADPYGWNDNGNTAKDRGFAWRPSIHMPRWASRLTLEITGVRVERVQEISEVDAIAEGATARLLCESIATLSKKANAQPLYWVGGDDEAGSFCRSCCEARVEELRAAGNRDAFVDGGFGTEEDAAAWCGCGVLLDCSFTNYGVEQELVAIERDGITSPADAHIAQAILNYGGNPLVGEECAGSVLRPDLKGRVARAAFRHLWNELNHDRGYGWDANPWVWALSFRRVPDHE